MIDLKNSSGDDFIDATELLLKLETKQEIFPKELSCNVHTSSSFRSYGMRRREEKAPTLADSAN